ncbi:phosphatidic acid phosphatase type 2 domain-containing protein 1B, putative [Entamoeba dispar SAW760]|uniref:Phosphatidic acid phosphatase type 2 domain-containing protein 1B, putative n=1 Tax=Entamoeba dispar (strain ATCC PRA-260 / SAW760) TaxID=370354 RepID=B0E9N0_ENTDS|nr:phosphatidic acid phosphatase type 2 domain-containing protein 1B, putative [Entamoeba dispar SAW760]EDR28748.1 phosphatidic acid phosphatase type 2 domain-containing protein 1B, putative [Entamoeba dispar SAW760]|eukprot:EDR28748.1 phosphatidic acid phosphatase type 2 domain-containing protein 1B, putative [Entamoeba dispar SAW760]
MTSTITFFFAVSLCLFLTNAFKLFSGKPRPNYYSLIDNNKASKGYQSFPSGHSSTTFNGMMFLTLLLCGEYKVFNGDGSILKLIGCCFPLLFGFLVAISRVRDYFHGYDDIIAGSLLGCVIALLCYVLKFRALWSKNSGEIKTEEYREFDDNFIV